MSSLLDVVSHQGALDWRQIMSSSQVDVRQDANFLLNQLYNFLIKLRLFTFLSLPFTSNK